MKTGTRALVSVLSGLMLAGCGQPIASIASAETAAQASAAVVAVSDMFSERDLLADYDATTSASIQLTGSTAECSSDAVNISDSTVTILDEGTYVVSGTLSNGMIIVNADKEDKVQLVLNGASINSATSAAIYVAQADKVFLTLAADTQNALANGGTFTAIDDSNIDAALFSKDDLTLNGQGALTISSPAGHGVVSKDDLVICGGEYAITAAGHGLCGKESVRIADGNFTISAEKDGIHAEDDDDASLGFGYIAAGAFDIAAGGDGISAAANLQIDGGSIAIQAGGGSETVTLSEGGNWDWKRAGWPQESGAAEQTVSAKALKATGQLLINSGTFDIDSADDALHAGEDLTVNDGVFEIATGDDGLHADADACVNGGTIVISKSYEGIEGQNILISGGSIDLISSDDGLNAAGGNDQSGIGGFDGFQAGGFDADADSAIIISGGVLHINASGDGVDSNGDLTVSGGETYVSGPTNDGNGSLDYSGEASISGGIFVAAGASGMAQNFGDSSTQGVMLVSVSGSENDTLTLEDSSGAELLRWTADKAFTCVAISCPEIKQGASYTVTVGDSAQEITMDRLIYDGAGGSGDFGGRRGNMDGKPGAWGDGSGNREGRPERRDDGAANGAGAPSAADGAVF